MTPELSIVLLNWNRAEVTLRCLKRIASWPTVRPEIWVVDNASVDDSLERIREGFPTVRLIAAPTNLGFGGGNNLALGQISQGYVLLLNNDALIDEEDLLRLVAALDDDPALGAVGPLITSGDPGGEILCAGGRDIGRYVNTYLRAEDVAPERLNGKRPYEVDYVSGTAVLLRASALGEVGLLDEEYFFGGELADLCERLRAHGYRPAIVPDARASHDTALASALRETLYPYYTLRNRFLFIRKFRRRQMVPLFAFWVAYGLRSALRATLRGAWSSARVSAGALLDGLTGRFHGQNERVAKWTNS